MGRLGMKLHNIWLFFHNKGYVCKRMYISNMSVYVYAYVCVNVCICMSVYVCTYLCVCVQMLVYKHVLLRIRICCILNRALVLTQKHANAQSWGCQDTPTRHSLCSFQTPSPLTVYIYCFLSSHGKWGRMLIILCVICWCWHPLCGNTHSREAINRLFSLESILYNWHSFQ